MMTDFENWPTSFPKVAESIQVTERDGDTLHLHATVKSFGQRFPVQMTTEILPGRGFTSDNESPKFGTSGHEELLLSDHPDGTTIDYTYQVAIHKRWLRLMANLVTSTLLRRWDRFTDEQKRFMIETIEADADRVTRLITELLDVSRIDARRLTIHARPVAACAAGGGASIDRSICLCSVLQSS